MDVNTRCKVCFIHVQAMIAALSDTYMWDVAAK